MNSFFGKIGRVIMIATNEYNPVVRFTQPPGDSVVNLIIIPWLVKSNPAISGNNQQGVRTSVSDAQLENKRPKVSVNVSGNDYLLGFWIVEQLHFAVQQIVLIFLTTSCLQNGTPQTYVYDCQTKDATKQIHLEETGNALIPGVNQYEVVKEKE